MRSSWIPVILLLGLGGLLGVFQNCTPSVPYGNTDYYAALVKSAEFPYEAGFDQLAYLSCSEQEDIFDDGTFFTFRVGAYDSMGLRISQTYRDKVKKVSDDNAVFALQESQTSAGSRLQLAVRTLDNLQLMYLDQENGVDGLDGSDFNLFFPAMGDEALSNILWYMEPADYLRYYSAAQFANQYRFQGDLRFMKSQTMENDLRSFLSNRGVITLTFANAGEITPLGPGSFTDLQRIEDGGDSGTIDGGGTTAPPGVNGASVGDSMINEKSSSSLATDVFGMAVQPRFKQPVTILNGSPGRDMPPRVLSTVNEIPIDGRLFGAAPRPWICPSNMQFMIVLPEHATYEDPQGNTITRCATRPDPINLSPDLQKMRQSLLSEDWYIDELRRCVVPKSGAVQEGSCYGLNTQTGRTHLINYDNYTEGCGFGNAEGLCPHYASICFRQ